MPMMVQTKHAAARSMHRTVLKGMIAALVLAATLNGCSTVAPRPGTVATAKPLVAQAAQLARSGATRSGAARQANDNEIDRLLSQLDDAALSREAAALPVGEPLYDYAGRALLRRGLPLPRPFDRTAWKFNAGQRPPAESDGYRPPVKLAVLLPGYYGEQRRRPEVVFYDTSGTAGGTLAAYDQAVAEGSDFVVGPLGRDEVGALYGKGALPVPVLALNRTGTEPPSGNASFSLSPEDEGLAAAEYLLDLNAKRVLVVGGADETQRRAVAALRGRLGERGAVVTDVASEGTSDFAPYAGKEGGVDAVFLAVRGTSARTLMPRLAAAGLAGKPRVATSQLLSGTGKPTEDAVLDGIAFPSEAWATRGARGLPSPATAGPMLAPAQGPAARRFAVGYAARHISAYLEYLATANNARIEGATGTLRLDGFGNVLRVPAWSTFRSGVAMPLPQGDRR